jgi:hypothetical protein
MQFMLFVIYVTFRLTRNVRLLLSPLLYVVKWDGPFKEPCQIPVAPCFQPKLLYETWIDKQPHFVTLRLRHVTHDDDMRFDS